MWGGRASGEEKKEKKRKKKRRRRRRRRRSGIIPWLDKADIAVVTMPLGLTFGGDGKKATTLAKKAREALALVGLTVADVLFYARDGGEAAVGNVLREMGKEELEKKAEDSEERMRYRALYEP